jgi:hypothetical protein
VNGRSGFCFARGYDADGDGLAVEAAAPVAAPVGVAAGVVAGALGAGE